MSKQEKSYLCETAEPEISARLHSVARKQGIPLSGTFELTSRCNFNCQMCYIHSGTCDKSDGLSAEQWIEMGKNAVDEGMLFLLLTGGEPLIRADFAYIYSELKKLGLVISLNTNGSLLNGDIAQLFKNNPPGRINVSLYGASEETYEKFTGVRAFGRIIENIELMRSYGIDVRLNCSLTRDNAEDMHNIFKLAKDMNLHIKTTPYMYPRLRVDGSFGENDRRLSAQAAAQCRVGWSLLKYDAQDFIDRANGMQKTMEMIEQGARYAFSEPRVLCRAGSSSFWVDNNGRMSPCGMIDKSFDISQLGFARAWKAVKEFTASIVLPSKCQSCKYRRLCHVCAAVCYTETGSFSGVPDYVCRLTEETARLTIMQAERLGNNHAD